MTVISSFLNIIFGLYLLIIYNWTNWTSSVSRQGMWNHCGSGSALIFTPGSGSGIENSSQGNYLQSFLSWILIRIKKRLDPDPHWDKLLDPYPPKMNADPQPCQEITYGLTLHGPDGLKSIGELQLQHPRGFRLPGSHKPTWDRHMAHKNINNNRLKMGGQVFWWDKNLSFYTLPGIIHFIYSLILI